MQAVQLTLHNHQLTCNVWPVFCLYRTCSLFWVKNIFNGLWGGGTSLHPSIHSLIHQSPSRHCSNSPNNSPDHSPLITLTNQMPLTFWTPRGSPWKRAGTLRATWGSGTGWWFGIHSWGDSGAGDFWRRSLCCWCAGKPDGPVGWGSGV